MYLDLHSQRYTVFSDFIIIIDINYLRALGPSSIIDIIDQSRFNEIFKSEMRQRIEYQYKDRSSLKALHSDLCILAFKRKN